MGRITRKATDAACGEQLLTLDQVEATLGGDRVPRPGDVAWVRTAPAILEAMARGDLTWAALMGRRLVFRVAVGTASEATGRRPTAAPSRGIVRRALVLAT